MEELPPPIPAATLVLMRPAPSGPPELLMMERPGHMAFAAGALVFPGGRIEAQDYDLARKTAGAPEDAAARIASIRETLEESGVAAAITPVDSTRTDQLRQGLLAGGTFGDLLLKKGLGLQLERLVPFARWCPNFRETRRFDAAFYLAEAPADAPEPEPQPGEVTRVFWASAASILDALDAGDAHAIFPTRRNLERLAGFASFEEARADALLHPVRTITPWVERREGADWVCIPDDLGYPVTAELLETARRR